MTDATQDTQAADFEFAALNEAKNYRAALMREFGPHLRGNVLEVGSGVGQITAELLQIPTIKKLVPIEPDAGFCARIRKRFPELELVEGTSRNLKAGTDWNAIVSINVLEHIEADVDELAVYHRLLSANRGRLCLFVPARPEIYAPIDNDFGHFRRYTRPQLRKRLKEASFRILHMRYYNVIGYFAWWASFCLLKKRTFDVGSVRFFDRAIFPLVHGFESRICAPPFGQSLIAVAEAE